MKRHLGSVLYLAGVLLALVAGYVSGSIQGQRVEWFYGQCNQMTYDYGLAKVIQDGKCDEAYRSAQHMAFLHHRNIVNSPLLHNKWVLPFVDVDGRALFAWGVNDAAKTQIQSVGESLKGIE